MKNEENQKD